MEPLDPVRPAVPVTADAPASQPRRLGGIRRSVATVGLALGLLAVGGVAVVMAASPEPSSSTTPRTTPSTQPSIDDDTTTTDRPAKGDCPEGSDGQDPAASPSTDTST